MIIQAYIKHFRQNKGLPPQQFCQNPYPAPAIKFILTLLLAFILNGLGLVFFLNEKIPLYISVPLRSIPEPLLVARLISPQQKLVPVEPHFGILKKESRTKKISPTAFKHIPKKQTAMNESPRAKLPLSKITVQTPAPSKAITLEAANPMTDNKAEIKISPKPAIDMGKIFLDAKEEARKIGQEVHKARSSLVKKPPDSVETRLSQGIASAALPQDIIIEEKLQQNGQKMTRVRGKYFSYCATREQDNLTHGIDTMQNGTRTRVTTCPD